MGYIGLMALKPPWEVRYLPNPLPQTNISKLVSKISGPEPSPALNEQSDFPACRIPNSRILKCKLTASKMGTTLLQALLHLLHMK